MTYRNKNISTEYANLIDTSKNDSNEKDLLFYDYLNLLEQYNIAPSQIPNMMDNYYINNQDKIEIIDMDEILSK